MNTYQYSAISKNGQKVRGVIEAYDSMDALEKIKRDCDIVMNIKEIKKKKGILNMELDARHLNKKAFTIMCSQFAIILKAGVPIGRTCHLLAEKTTDKKLKKMLEHVAQDVESGRRISDSLEDRGKPFLPITFVETIRAGEESGNLEQAFQTMFVHYDKQTKMAAKVRSALIYPIFVICVAIAVVIVLMVKVVPTFTAIFDSFNAQLPLITRILIAISNFFKKGWIFLLILTILFYIVFKFLNNTENGRIRFAKIQLKLPVIGNISQLNAASELANTMSTMLGSGITITKSISITAKVMSNYYVSQEIGKLTLLIEEGNNLGDSIKNLNCLPDILKDMIAVGEETGELEETLSTVASFYDTELEMAIERAMKKLEPSLLIFISVVAGFIVIAMYVAMFSMYNYI